MYKKISLSFQSGYTTPLESDTILGYVFAHCFAELKDVFEKFKLGNPSFMISDGFVSGVLPKPFLQLNIEKKESDLIQDMQNEVARKENKSLKALPIDKELIKRYFDRSQKTQEELRENIEQMILSLKENQQPLETIDLKNSIPRFDSGDTEPYALDEIKRFDGNYTIFVRIFDDGGDDFEIFYRYMEKVLTSIGRGKYKSKGYGQIKHIALNDLEEHEQQVFNFLDSYRTQGQYYVLNNYKPSDQDLKHLDLEKSYYQIHHKHATSGDNADNPFKGTMHFFAPGSVLKFTDGYKPTGSNYISPGNGHEKYNFGFIF